MSYIETVLTKLAESPFNEKTKTILRPKIENSEIDRDALKYLIGMRKLYQLEDQEIPIDQLNKWLEEHKRQKAITRRFRESQKVPDSILNSRYGL